MSLPRTVADVLRDHVTLEVEGIDRMYLNVYQPHSDRTRRRRLLPLPSRAALRLLGAHGRRSARPSSPPSSLRRARTDPPGHLRQGATQGRRRRGVPRPLPRQARGSSSSARPRRRHRSSAPRSAAIPTPGRSIPGSSKHGDGQPLLLLLRRRGLRPVLPQVLHLLPLQRQALPQRPRVRQAATGQGRDRLRGPGQRHPVLRRPRRLQQLCDGLSAAKIDALLRKWLARLPHPFTAADRQAGYRYDVSILQAEFSLTQVLDRPLTGRIFFEEVIRENLDLGRPDQVQLIFDRRVTKRTPGRFRTRVLTEGVTPSLHVDYKHSRIKQYHKEGRALRTETTINDTRDFGIGKRLNNSARLAGDRLPSQPTSPGRPTDQPGLCRSAKTRSAGATNRSRSMANGPVPCVSPTCRCRRLFSALLVFRLLPRGFSNRDLRDHWAPLLGKCARRHDPGTDDLPPAAAALARPDRADPRDPSLPGDGQGCRTLLFCTRSYNRLLRPALPRSSPRKLWTIPSCAEALMRSIRCSITGSRQRRCRHET